MSVGWLGGSADLGLLGCSQPGLLMWFWSADGEAEGWPRAGCFRMTSAGMTGELSVSTWKVRSPREAEAYN